VGFLKTINNLKVLCKYAPYRNVEDHGLFVNNNATFQHDFLLYLMGSKSFPPLITWIIGKRATYCFGTLAQHDTQTR
jgi:tRNA splicing endonuclease